MTATTTDSEFVVPMASNYVSKGTYASYPTTRVDVRKTTIARKTDEAVSDMQQNANATEQTDAVKEAGVPSENKEEAEDDKGPASYWGTVYSNGYPYNDMKTYEDYLKNFYASSQRRNQPTNAIVKTGKWFHGIM